MNMVRTWKMGVVGLSAMALLGGVVMFLSTEKGVGLGFDSIHYIAGARSLISGFGLGRMTCTGFKPLVLWPPLYPYLLAGFGILGIDALVAARVVSVAGFGAAVFLCGLLLQNAGRGWVPAWIGAALVLLSPPLTRSLSWAMSESLYVPLTLLTLVLAKEYLEQGRMRFLVVAGFAAGAAALTRTIGLALVVGLIFVIGTEGRIAWSKRAAHAAMVFLFGAGPLVAWTVWNRYAYGSGVGRVIALHLPERSELSRALRMLVDWFLGASVSRGWAIPVAAMLVGFMGAVIVKAIAGARKERRTDASQWVLAVHCLTYTSVLLATAAFVTPTVSLVEERLLVPAYIGLLLIVATSAWDGIRTGRWEAKVLLYLGLAIFLTVHLWGQIKEVASLREDGQGFASERWSQSPSGEVLRSSDGGVIFTNDIQAVYFISERASCAIPTYTSAMNLDEMHETLARSGGLIVVFGKLSGEFLPIEDVTAGAEVWKVLPDSTIYTVPEESGNQGTGHPVNDVSHSGRDWPAHHHPSRMSSALGGAYADPDRRRRLRAGRRGFNSPALWTLGTEPSPLKTRQRRGEWQFQGRRSHERIAALTEGPTTRRKVPGRHRSGH